MKLRNCIVKTAAWMLIIFAAIEFLWLFVGTALLNKYLSDTVITKFFPQNVKVISNYKIKTNPDFSIRIKAENAVITKNEKEVIKAKNLKTTIKLIPLITKKIQLNNILADELTINLEKSKDGSINIEQIIPDIIKRLNIKTVYVKNLSIPKYIVNFTNEDFGYKSSLNGKNLNIIEFCTNKKIIANTTGTISSRNKTAEFAIDTSVEFPLPKSLAKKNSHVNIILKEVDLSVFAPLTKYFAPNNIKDINGIISGTISTTNSQQQEKLIVGNLTTKNLYVKENLPENDTFLKEDANINFTLLPKANTLTIKEFHLNTIFHNIDLNGNIYKLDTKKPQLDLKLKLHNDIKSMIYNAIPSEIEFEDRMIAKIKKYKPKATVDGEIKIQGDAIEPDITGEFYTPNLFIDQQVANEAKATLKLEFLKSKLHVISHVVPSKGTFVEVDGMINMYGDKSAIFNIESSKNIPLPLTRAVLMPIQDTFGLNFGILNQIYAQKGKGDAKLYIDGTRTDAIVNGRLNFYDGKANLIGLNTFIDNVSGYLNFNKKDADFATYTSTINGQKINIKGTGNFDGSFTLNLNSNNIQTQTLYDILTTSEILKPVTDSIKDLDMIKTIKGDANISIDIKGKMSDLKGPINLNDATYNGQLLIKNNLLEINGLKTPITLENLQAEFKPKKIDLTTTTKILSSKSSIKALISDKTTRFDLTAPQFMLKDIVSIAANEGYIAKRIATDYPTARTSYITLNANYNSNSKFDINKLNLDAKIKNPQLTNNNKLAATQGSINIKNGNAEIKQVTLNLLDSFVTLDGSVKNLSAKEPNYNLAVGLKNINMAHLNKLPPNKNNSTIVKIISAYENYKGLINGHLTLKKSNINGKIHASNISFIHKKMQLPFNVENADVVFRNDTMIINKLNASVDDVPVFINASIKEYLKRPIAKVYLTSNIYPGFINKYINANLGYPIKLKGEMGTKTFFIGNIDNLKATTILTLPAGSDLSYMGANLGEEDSEREIKLETQKNGNQIFIKNGAFSKYITSLNSTHTKYPYIVTSGKIILKDEPYYENFKIKTIAQTSIKFFNILFKKSILKFGDFECDMTLNGRSSAPKITGFIKLRNLDMPLYETTVQDIYADFAQNDIDIKILGSILDTNITAAAKMANNLSAPYKFKNIDITADYLDLDKIFDSISKVSIQNIHSPKLATGSDIAGSDLSDVFIEKGTLSAKKIVVKGFPATDLTGTFNKRDNDSLNITDFDFNIANGTIKAKGNYNIKSNLLSADCIAQAIDANQFSQIFLNVKNQIFGNLNGTVKFSTSGSDPTKQLENLYGNIDFIIKDGKMPKLGSLEYLLRAGNIIKNGITGFTINNIIELLVPIRTGEFSSINGNINISAGKADNIQIYSRGKNLSLYITGNADLTNGQSQMEVYGKLSKKITTLLGPIGNTSLSTLLSLIPGTKITEAGSQTQKNIDNIPKLELSTDDYRFFRALIDGDINGDNYVKSFKWLE